MSKSSFGRFRGGLHTPYLLRGDMLVSLNHLRTSVCATFFLRSTSADYWYSRRVCGTFLSFLGDTTCQPRDAWPAKSNIREERAQLVERAIEDGSGHCCRWLVIHAALDSVATGVEDNRFPTQSVVESHGVIFGARRSIANQSNWSAPIYFN